ncbi:MAG TPA: hypothetical protein PKJ41_03535 [Bryobacteraceae bacterium]|nr:hypothetical protein [Bryobacteraceae bacterium]
MAHFPQLESGCMGQYPLRRTLSLRTYSSESPGGKRRAAFDAGGSTVRWKLPLTGLSESEAEAIQGLFQASDGRRRSFMFVDPFANLLGGTDDLAGTLWEKGPGVVVAGGVRGPDGQAEACSLANTSGVWSGVSQALAIPEAMNYCMSAWVRSAGGGSVKLSIGDAQRVVETGSEWRQAWVSGVDGTSPVQFMIAAPAGETVEVYGPQAEAQIAPSEYKRNRGRGGWYPRARFESNELNLEAEAPGLYGCEVAIVSPWEE